ncbi:MAG: helix-turn-helix domain-containing protein [Actinomyces bowdenii]|nr:helix-turn-helix domain-containing protein [Actinomyces bowdenii]
MDAYRILTHREHGVVVNGRQNHENLEAAFQEYGRFLSVPETAELLGMTKQGLYNWVREGIVPAYKVASTWLILRDDLKELIRTGSNQTRTTHDSTTDPPAVLSPDPAGSE